MVLAFRCLVRRRALTILYLFGRNVVLFNDDLSNCHRPHALSPISPIKHKNRRRAPKSVGLEKDRPLTLSPSFSLNTQGRTLDTSKRKITIHRMNFFWRLDIAPEAHPFRKRKKYERDCKIYGFNHFFLNQNGLRPLPPCQIHFLVVCPNKMLLNYCLVLRDNHRTSIETSWKSQFAKRTPNLLLVRSSPMIFLLTLRSQ